MKPRPASKTVVQILEKREASCSILPILAATSSGVGNMNVGESVLAATAHQTRTSATTDSSPPTIRIVKRRHVGTVLVPAALRSPEGEGESDCSSSLAAAGVWVGFTSWNVRSTPGRLPLFLAVSFVVSVCAF